MSASSLHLLICSSERNACGNLHAKFYYFFGKLITVLSSSVPYTTKTMPNVGSVGLVASRNGYFLTVCLKDGGVRVQDGVVPTVINVSGLS